MHALPVARYYVQSRSVGCNVKLAWPFFTALITSLERQYTDIFGTRPVARSSACLMRGAPTGSVVHQ